jgi:hypothetical protein
MDFSKEDIVTLVKGGGAISVDASGLGVKELVEIAALASQVDTTVTLRNLGAKSVDDLLAIIKAGADSVMLEL